MRSKGLLIAAVVLIVVGMLGAGASAAVLAVQSARNAGDGSGPPIIGRSTEATEGTSTTTPPRGGPRRFTPPSGGFSSEGESIWLSGVGRDGAIPRDPAFGPAMMGGCATCHGRDGRGGSFRMMGRTFDAPDIRYSTLTTRHTEGGRTVEPWTEEEIFQAVRDGLEPGGEHLEDTMPRWDISRAEFAELIAYMKRL